jgi:hypothetical protein
MSDKPVIADGIVLLDELVHPVAPILSFFASRIAARLHALVAALRFPRRCNARSAWRRQALRLAATFTSSKPDGQLASRIL